MPTEKTITLLKIIGKDETEPKEYTINNCIEMLILTPEGIKKPQDTKILKTKIASLPTNVSFGANPGWVTNDNYIEYMVNYNFPYGLRGLMEENKEYGWLGGKMEYSHNRPIDDPFGGAGEIGVYNIPIILLEIEGENESKTAK